jgi:TetR/AcrR family tetracycline transcriptional repressor
MKSIGKIRLNARHVLVKMWYSLTMRTRVFKHAPLQPETVVKTALEMLNAEGLESVTVRRLAAKLGVQAPALYWHFKNKQDILDEMAHALRETLLSRREGARVVAGAGFGRARALAELTDRTIGVLHMAGFDTLSASFATTTIVSYTFGFAIEEQAVPQPDSQQALDFLATQFPLLVDAVKGRETVTEVEQFDWGVQVIIQGLQVSRQDSSSTVRDAAVESERE